MKCYIGLGSNLGDQEEALRNALRMMGESEGIEVTAVSEFLDTEPVGGPQGQGNYLNAAVEIITTLEPHKLLSRLQQIEQALGRTREAERRWGPRTCDLDILLMGDLVLESEDLTIPHPLMHERLFVLEPLVSIAPDVAHPVSKKTISQLMEEARK